jgi:acetyl esterase/lipase
MALSRIDPLRRGAVRRHDAASARGIAMKKACLTIAAWCLLILPAHAANPTGHRASTQSHQWLASLRAGGEQVALWPAGLAITRPEVTGPETASNNVVRPTMTIYRPAGRNSGAALMVYPGGGYQGLAVGLEGTEVCDWATRIGMTCAVVRYRVPQKWWHADCHCQREPVPFLPLQDAERAMRLLRQRAASLGVNPHRIGVIGFSAGGHLTTAISNADGHDYAPVDKADALSARPDFAMPIYPGHLWSGNGGPGADAVDLFAFDPVRADAPPTFIVQAEDDPVDDVRNSISYFLALRAAKVPAEMHIYPHGGHAFGLRPTSQPISRWPALAQTWLHTIGMLKEAK